MSRLRKVASFSRLSQNQSEEIQAMTKVHKALASRRQRIIGGGPYCVRHCDLEPNERNVKINPTIKPLTERQAWNALAAHHRSVRELHLRKLFTDDPKRGERMTAEAVGLYLDYSKNRITDETLKLLLQLADESGLRQRIDAMFRGEKINVTENRAVLHVALRAVRPENSNQL
jgi:hypothetical protein